MNDQLKKLHDLLDGLVGVAGFSKQAYDTLGHGRWLDLLHGVISYEVGALKGTPGVPVTPPAK